MPTQSFSRKQLIYLVLILATLAGCAGKPEQREAAFLDSGRKHFQARDFDRAALDFRNASSAMPQDPEPRYQLGLTYLEKGNAAAATSELLRAVQLDPKHAAAQLKLAQIMTMNRNPSVVKAGEKKAQEVLAGSPDNPDALQALAFAELRFQNPDEAVQHLEQALEKAPENLKAATTLALVKIRNKDFAGAEQVMQKAVTQAPRSTEHVAALGHLYLLIGKPADAETQFRRALEIDPKYGPALVELGGILFRNAKLNEAEQVFRRASALPDKQYRPLHAIFLLDTGKSDQALAEFLQQYQSERENRDARTRLIVAYLRLDKTADASNVLSEALKRNSKDGDALMQQGELNLAAGKYQDAQTNLTEVLRLHPDSPQAHLVLARIHQARNAASSQIQELTEALRLNPRLLAARTELAHALTLSGSPKAGLDVLDKAPAEDQRSLGVTIERNAAYYALGDYAQVRKGIDEGLAISRHPLLVLQDGLLRVTQRDYKGARASLEEVLKQRPQDWIALQALADSYSAEKRPSEATALVKQYTSRFPDSAGAQWFLGSWLSRGGDLAGAREAFLKAKSLAPSSTQPDLGLAGVALAENKLDSARDTLNSILSREPRNVAALLDLAGVEEWASRPLAAIEDYERVVQEDPRNIAGLNNLAYLLADTGKDPDRALKLAQQVKELVPNNAAVDDTIGWAYYQKGLFQASLDYLSKAATTGTPRRKCHLAMAYIKLGDRQRAAVVLQAALKDDPSIAEGRKALELLAKAH